MSCLPCGEASIVTRLEDGRAICIRTVTPGDEGRLRAGIAAMSPRSRYLRFFSGGASPPDWVIERLLDADGVLHLAWGALDLTDPAQPAMGVVHAMRPDAGDAVAEFSVGVVDAYHGLGVGRLLTATLLIDAAAGRMEALRAHVLSENDAARSFISLGVWPAGSSVGPFCCRWSRIRSNGIKLATVCTEVRPEEPNLRQRETIH